MAGLLLFKTDGYWAFARPERPSASLLFLPRATAIACKERLTAERFGLAHECKDAGDRAAHGVAAERQFLINKGALKHKSGNPLAVKAPCNVIALFNNRDTAITTAGANYHGGARCRCGAGQIHGHAGQGNLH